MKIKSLLGLISLSAMLTLNFSSCKDDDNDVKKEPEPEKITDVTSSNMSDYLKSQTSGSTITVALTETNPDFAKIREALSNNANVNVKLDLAKCIDLKEIPENAFYKSDNSLKKVGGENGFKNLVAIILPETVVKIGNNAFRDCILLTEINLPDKTEEIGSYVFANCQSLTLIVIPKSVLKIGENVFEGCTQIEIKNNSNVELNNNQDDNFEILPKKITKIVGHWSEFGADDKGNIIHDKGYTRYFIYDSEGRVQYVIGESTQPSEYDKRSTTTYTYTANSITSANRYSTGNYTLRDGLIISYKKSDGYYEDNSSYNYTDGYLTNVTTGGYETADLEIIDRTFKYTYNNGLITTSEDNVGSKYTYEYTNVKNNLNIDVFAMIDEAGYTTECLSPFFGKRNKYLPSKITEFDDGEIEYEYTITYQFDGDYISKIGILCTRAGGKYQYEEMYEIYYDPIDITPEPEEYVEPVIESLSFSDIAVSVTNDGKLNITGKINSNTEIKSLELVKADYQTTLINLLKDGDADRIKALYEAGQNGKEYSLEIPTFAFPIDNMKDGIILKAVTKGGKTVTIPITEMIYFEIGAANSYLGAYFSFKELRSFMFAEAKENSVDIYSKSAEDGYNVIGFKKASTARSADVAAKAGKVAFFQNGTSVEEVSEGGVIITESGVICLISKITNNQDAIASVEGYIIKEGKADIESVDVSALSSTMSK
ncbi:MAG: leucine-rich repeat protein [Bacteroidales bacterium]|nr:leucine-rich repeat protein [Bacteroidales bacterium]